MATKKTQKELYTEILAIVKDNAELTDFVKSRIEQIEKKASSSTKMTAKQVENEKLKVAILDFMVEGRGYTIKELMKEVPELAAIEGLSNQKVSAILRLMKDVDKTIYRTEEKRVVYFHKA